MTLSKTGTDKDIYSNDKLVHLINIFSPGGGSVLSVREYTWVGGVIFGFFSINSISFIIKLTSYNF